MEEKKIYRIVDNDYPEDAVYVLLTEAQVKTIENFLEWADIAYGYSIEKVDNITPVEW